MKIFQILIIACGLVACGGRGSPASTNKVSTASLTVTGTATTGLMLAGAMVSGKCTVGSDAMTTQSDDGFSLVVPNGQSPCLLQITDPSDGNELHKVVLAAGYIAASNLTPLTQMTVAQVLSANPNTFFSVFDPAVASKKITTSSFQTA